MSRFLISGFKPFGDWADNSSEWLVQQLARDPVCRPWIERAVILPVDHRESFRQIRPHLSSSLAGVVSFGQARSSKIRLERQAYNRFEQSGQQEGGTVLVHGAPKVMSTKLPIQRLQKQLRAAGLGTRISEAPGRWVCNALFFRLLREALPIPRGFIHLPPRTDPAWADERLLYAGQLILQCLNDLNTA